MNDQIKHRQILKGKIVSLPSSQMAVIEVMRYLKHPKYKKYFRRSRKYSAEHKIDQLKIGQSVIIESSRPISKTKKWVVKELAK